MRDKDDKYTRHARQRIQQRSIPSGVVALIQEFGCSCDAGDGAMRYVLSKKSFRAIKRRFGHGISEALAAYRNTYVVAKDGLVITAARAKRPTIH